MKTFNLQKSKLQLFSAIFLLISFLFILLLPVIWITVNHHPPSLPFILIFSIIILNNFFMWWAVPKYSFVGLDEEKITYKYLFIRNSYSFNMVKSVFFYKMNHTQLVLNLSNGEKKYIPVKVEKQAEYLGLLREILINKKLCNNEVNNVIDTILKKAK